MPKLTINQVLDAPNYYVDHFDGKYDTDKVVILRDACIISDTTMLKQSLEHLPGKTHILDLTNNDLVAMPPLGFSSTIHTVLLGRNRIQTIDGSAFPINAVNISLMNNEINELEQLSGLKSAPKSLQNICLRGNNVCYVDGYREYVLSSCPQLKVLDFQRCLLYTSRCV